MVLARQQPIAAREKERFPTEWTLYDGDEQEGEQASQLPIDLNDAVPLKRWLFNSGNRPTSSRRSSRS